MLVLSRKSQETLIIGGGVELPQSFKVTVLGISGGRVQLGFEADTSISIRRKEVQKRYLDRPETDVLQNCAAPPNV